MFILLYMYVCGSIVAEAAPIPTEAGGQDPTFQFVRIAHISSRATHQGSELTSQEVHGYGSDDADSDWQIGTQYYYHTTTITLIPYRTITIVGPFAASPIAQKGCTATFSHFSIGPRLQSVHSAEL